VSVPPLTWLYAPADRPDRVAKAIASRAHAVIVDLEDGVAPAGRAAARDALPGVIKRSETGAAEAGLDWARSRIVNAAVAAGLPRPPQSVYARLGDDEGLLRSCLRGRELGHLGRTTIHPAQLEVIEDAYPPTDEEVEHARATLARTAPGTLADGSFVDPAMTGAAALTVALANRYGVSRRIGA